MNNRRLLMSGAVAVMLLGGGAVAHASYAQKTWNIGPCGPVANTDTTLCAGLGQETHGGSGGSGHSTRLGANGMGFAQGEESPGGFFYFRKTGVYAAGVGVGQFVTEYPSGVPLPWTRDTGVWVSGDNPVFVGQHVDTTNNTCVLRVESGAQPPVDVPCPIEAAIPEIPQLFPYMAPPLGLAVERTCTGVPCAS